MPLNGGHVPVVSGFQNPADYLKDRNFLGAIVGRVGNRISGASFEIGPERFDLQANEPPNQLHGGARGIYTRNWAMQTDGARAVRLHLISPDGDQGFPGRVEVEVTISLSGYTLTYDMVARSDRVTPINLAQHSYYNLMGQGTVFDHAVQINADRYTPVDEFGIPTGEIAGLAGHDFDLRNVKTIEQAGGDLDMNFVLSGPTDVAARVSAPNGLTLEMTTDQPCLQLYTGSNQRPGSQPWDGQKHVQYSGLCLEPQNYINAVNVAGFPSILISPDHPYHQTTKVRIAPPEAL